MIPTTEYAYSDSDTLDQHTTWTPVDGEDCCIGVMQEQELSSDYSQAAIGHSTPGPAGHDVDRLTCVLLWDAQLAANQAISNGDVACENVAPPRFLRVILTPRHLAQFGGDKAGEANANADRLWTLPELGFWVLLIDWNASAADKSKESGEDYRDRIQKHTAQCVYQPPSFQEYSAVFEGATEEQHIDYIKQVLSRWSIESVSVESFPIGFRGERVTSQGLVRLADLTKILTDDPSADVDEATRRDAYALHRLKDEALAAAHDCYGHQELSDVEARNLGLLRSKRSTSSMRDDDDDDDNDDGDDEAERATPNGEKHYAKRVQEITVHRAMVINLVTVDRGCNPMIGQGPVAFASENEPQPYAYRVVCDTLRRDIVTGDDVPDSTKYTDDDVQKMMQGDERQDDSSGAQAPSDKVRQMLAGELPFSAVAVVNTSHVLFPTKDSALQHFPWLAEHDPSLAQRVAGATIRAHELYTRVAAAVNFNSVILPADLTAPVPREFTLTYTLTDEARRLPTAFPKPAEFVVKIPWAQLAEHAKNSLTHSDAQLPVVVKYDHPVAFYKWEALCVVTCMRAHQPFTLTKLSYIGDLLRMHKTDKTKSLDDAFEQTLETDESIAATVEERYAERVARRAARKLKQKQRREQMALTNGDDDGDASMIDESSMSSFAPDEADDFLDQRDPLAALPNVNVSAVTTNALLVSLAAHNVAFDNGDATIDVKARGEFCRAFFNSYRVHVST